MKKFWEWLGTGLLVLLVPAGLGLIVLWEQASAPPPSPTADSGAAVSLSELVAAGAVEVEAQGAGVALVNLTLRNLTGQPIKAHVPPGTYFRSDQQNVQNMVTTAPVEIFLYGDALVTQPIAAACANLHLAEPSYQNTLALAPQSIEGPLAQALAMASDESVEARQAAVWIMTDDASLGELHVLNTMTDVAAADGARLLAEAGVDLHERKIWNDFPSLLGGALQSGAEDEALWLWTAMGRPLEGDYQYTGASTPYLLAAARCGCIAMIDALVEAGADVNQSFLGGGSYELVPIAEAATNRAAVEHLLDLGARPDAPELWIRAIALGARDVVDLLVERGAEPPTDAPLLAYARGDPTLIALLLTLGQQVDRRDESGQTPLHAAVQNPEGVRLLLAAGADPNARTPDGRTVLYELVAQTQFGPDTLATLELLRGAGADLTTRDVNDGTLLHAAAYYGWGAEGVDALVSAGLDPNAVDAAGQTPLHSAAGSFDALTMTNALLAAGADPNIADDYGDTPLHILAQKEYGADLGAVNALVDAGARRLRNDYGRTPEELVPEDQWWTVEMRQALARASD